MTEIPRWITDTCEVLKRFCRQHGLEIVITPDGYHARCVDAD